MPTIIYSESELKNAINVLSEKIIDAHQDTLQHCVLVGILPRGVPVAHRIARYIQKTKNIAIPVGQLEVGLYRDNILEKNTYVALQETDIPFRLKNKILILINDVFYEGKGIRAALNTLLDFDSPEKIELGVILDRGNRKLPIHPDYVVQKIVTNPNDIMETKLVEIDGEDNILLIEALSSTQKA